jgi:cytochrome c553
LIALHRLGAVALACTLYAATGLAAEDAAVPAFRQLDSMEARVQGCVTCHGPSGQGTANGYFPRIAGKPAGYLYNQLVAFRDGTRRYTPMNYLVAYLPDAYLREIADYFAKQRPPFTSQEQASVDAAVIARGQAIVTQGDGQRGIPPCIACHGAALTGMNPGIPGLVGLRSSYIAAQLTRWRVSERHAAEPDCMKRIASRLSETDIAAVAAWLARQAPPADASPESPNRMRMPLACGSQP